MSKKPNILLITSDQQRADCFGFENPRIRTPHLDRLAQGGTRFSACITPNLVCQPSRASILTGLLPLTHGVWDNGVDLDPRVGEQGFAGTLAKAGYDPTEAPRFWQRFGSAHAGNKPMEFMSTHPSDATRISQLQAKIPLVLPLYEQAKAAGRRPNCKP